MATFSFVILSCIGSFCQSKEKIWKWGFVCCPQMSGHYVQCQLLVNLVLFSCHLSLHCWWREYWEGLPIGIGFSSGIDPWLFLVVRDTNHKKKFLLLPVKASIFLQLQSPPALCLQSVLYMIVHLAIQRRRKIQEECLWSSRVSSDNSFLQWKIAWECLILKWCAGCGVKLRFMN